jgi:hypothetical protein
MTTLSLRAATKLPIDFSISTASNNKETIPSSA